MWNYNTTKSAWTPDLVNFKVKVSILDVKWSKRGDKFVTTTGSKLVSTGYYDDELKMWNCKSMKDHKSSVTCAKFDNSGMFILSGSTDLKAIISSAYIPEIDKNYSNQPLPFDLVS